MTMRHGIKDDDRYGYGTNHGHTEVESDCPAVHWTTANLPRSAPSAS